MSQSTDRLHLALGFPEPGQCNPKILVLNQNDEEVTRISTAEPAPRLGLGDRSVRSVEALDILEHVHDEQAWLAELARILASGGELIVRVPLDNLVAWADALNIYRYLSDTTGRGEQPLETMPIGWHRHYAPSDLPAILELAGFEAISITTEGLPLGEIPHLAGLIAGLYILGNAGSERQLFMLRTRFRDRARISLPARIASTMTVHAKRVQPDYRPDPDLDESQRPEQGAAGPLE